MNALDIMKRPAAYVSGYENTPTEEQNRAKQLCWEYNRTAPNEQEKRRSILQTLLGTQDIPWNTVYAQTRCDSAADRNTMRETLLACNYVTGASFTEDATSMFDNLIVSLNSVVVLIIVSLRKKREDQPPTSLGLNYFREDR